MITVKVHFANGDSITTGINGTIQEIREYYKPGKVFNIGSVSDNLQKVVDLEFLDCDEWPDGKIHYKLS